MPVTALPRSGPDAGQERGPEAVLPRPKVTAQEEARADRDAVGCRGLPQGKALHRGGFRVSGSLYVLAFAMQVVPGSNTQ